MRLAAIVAATVGITFVFAAGSHATYAATLAQTNSVTPIKKSKRSKKIIAVKRGDYLYKLAKMYNTTVQRLFYANTQIKSPNLIYPGEELVVPDANEQLTPRPWPSGGDPPAKSITTSSQPSGASSDSDDSGSSATPTQAASAPETPTTTTSTTRGNVWDSLAQCESGGNWSADTGNGYYGGLQFTLGSWQAVGGTGYPSDASPAEQIAVAQRLLADQGWNAWPTCSAQLGL